MDLSEPTITSQPKETPETIYEYQPIHSKSEIRILELHPPDPHDPNGALHGNLVTAKLADKPSYEAISYVWGPAIFSERLHLPTGTLGLTPSLAAALRRFRYPDRKRRLWADAVCIDQQNGGDEKSHQVQLMGKVFKNTDHMLAWLGEGDEDTDAVITFLEDLANESWRYGVSAERPNKTLLRPSKGGAGVRMALEDLQFQILANRAPFEKFFQQEWFHRLWIVQEVALPSKFTIRNGTSTLSHDIFSDEIACLYLMLSLPNSLVDSIYLETMQLMVVRWSQQSDTFRIALVDLIRMMRAKRYSNELDSIYALLGLSRDYDDISLEVNYERSLGDLLTNVTSRYISRGNLWVMQFAGRGAENLQTGGHKHTSSLPSWVGNYGCTAKWRLKIQSGSRRKVSIILKPEILPLVGIRGSLIDNPKLVVQTPDTLFERQKENEERSDILQFFLKLWEIWHQSREEGPRTSYYLQESEESVFARTLMVDGMLINAFPAFYSAGISALLCHWRHFQHIASQKYNANEGTDDQTPYEEKDVEDYLFVLIHIFYERVFIITHSGYIGVGPRGMKEGDAIVTFDGNIGMPFILRRVEGDASHVPTAELEDLLDDITYADIKEKWELIGFCYLHGFMHGEEEQPEFEDRRQMFFIQ